MGSVVTKLRIKKSDNTFDEKDIGVLSDNVKCKIQTNEEEYMTTSLTEELKKPKYEYKLVYDADAANLDERAKEIPGNHTIELMFLELKFMGVAIPLQTCRVLNTTDDISGGFNKDTGLENLHYLTTYRLYFNTRNFGEVDDEYEVYAMMGITYTTYFPKGQPDKIIYQTVAANHFYQPIYYKIDGVTRQKSKITPEDYKEFKLIKIYALIRTQ